MKITPVFNINYYQRKTNFKGNYKAVHNEQGELLYRTTTFPFREDLDWTQFVNLLDRKYKNTPIVNIICHACSNGAEPYSLAAKLTHMMGDKTNKFLPIQAKDLDIENIKTAKQGKIETDINELVYANYRLGGNYRDYFDVEDLNSKDASFFNKRYITPKNFLKDKVIFEQGDILDDIDNMPRSNTVLLCRNFWPYLTNEKREELADKISKHFDETCLIVVGDYDKSRPDNTNFDVEKLFKEYGLCHTIVKNVWTLPQKN